MSGHLFEAQFESALDGPLESLFGAAVGAARRNGAVRLLVTVSAKIRDEEPDDDGKPYGWMDQEIKMVPRVLTYDEAAASHIRAVLDSADGNKTEAAKILGLKRTTLVEKMKRLGMM